MLKVLISYDWCDFIGQIIYIMLYKLINHKWKIYLKLDDDEKFFIKNFFNRKIMNLIIWLFVDCVSVETRWWLNKYKKYWTMISRKIVYMPNWYNDELIWKICSKIKTWEIKNNAIFTVARIWVYQKNHELFLKVIENLDLKDWVVYLIWPINDDFNTKIEDFYKKNPNLKWKVIFTWPIYNKKELYEYYNNSKIFLMTSRYEWYPLVFPDALYFWNRIITTDVSSVYDITNNGMYGDVIKNDSWNVCWEFVNILQNYIDGKLSYNSNDGNSYAKQFKWSNLVNIPWKKLGLS